MGKAKIPNISKPQKMNQKTKRSDQGGASALNEIKQRVNTRNDFFCNQFSRINYRKEINNKKTKRTACAGSRGRRIRNF